jgi:hypothetical protein
MAYFLKFNNVWNKNTGHCPKNLYSGGVMLYSYLSLGLCPKLRACFLSYCSPSYPPLFLSEL